MEVLHREETEPHRESVNNPVKRAVELLTPDLAPDKPIEPQSLEGRIHEGRDESLVPEQLPEPGTHGGVYRGSQDSAEYAPGEESDNEFEWLPLILVAPVDPYEEKERDGVSRDKVHQVAVDDLEGLAPELQQVEPGEQHHRDDYQLPGLGYLWGRELLICDTRDSCEGAPRKEEVREGAQYISDDADFIG